VYGPRPFSYVRSDSQRTGARDIIQTCPIRNRHGTFSAVMLNRPLSFSVLNKFQKPCDTIVVLTTQHVDRMHGKGDVSIPKAIVSYGFRNLFRNEKGTRTISLYAKPSLWRFENRKFNSVVMSYRLGKFETATLRALRNRNSSSVLFSSKHVLKTV